MRHLSQVNLELVDECGSRLAPPDPFQQPHAVVHPGEQPWIERFYDTRNTNWR
jgi:hypothetical protein